MSDSRSSSDLHSNKSEGNTDIKEQNEEMETSSGNEMDDGEEESSDSSSENVCEEGVYVHNRTRLGPDEELVMDRSAYLVYQQATTTSPCLSFDILRDNLGDNRAEVYPLTIHAVAGTQAGPTDDNYLLCMKMFNISRVLQNDNDDAGDEPDDNFKVPKLSVANVPHHGVVNRVRARQLNDRRYICASWCEDGAVYLTDIGDAIAATEASKKLSIFNNNKHTASSFFKFTGHKKEGFALDWSPVVLGQMASGDCLRDIHVWRMAEAGRWKVDDRSLVGHTDSVEDIQWSPNEATVMASCSMDKSIRIFDIRANPAKACMLSVSCAHSSDVNVISWNRLEQAFLLSGGDDGLIKVWDLRQIKSLKPVSQFAYHSGPITSIEWHPTDATVFLASSEDDSVTLWDLAVERDEDSLSENLQSKNTSVLNELPPQLLFIHQGQQAVKECHWHPQIPGLMLSTAQSGFDIFRTISV